MSLTIHGCEDDPGVVVGNNICIAVLWLVDLQVGVLPGELLSRINRLTDKETQQAIFYDNTASNSSPNSPIQEKPLRNKLVIPPTAL